MKQRIFGRAVGGILGLSGLFLLNVLTACGSEVTDDALVYCDVEPIFAEHCTKCHYEGESAQGPMPLETYEQVFENRHHIATWVENGTMPFKASGFPVTISDEERDMIVEWSSGAAKPGTCD